MTAQVTQPGYCECGCGERVNLAPHDDWRRGWTKGKPIRFVGGHQSRGRTKTRYREEDRGYATPCWIWQLALSHNGYGRFDTAGRMWPAHRYFYLQKFGEIPDGLELDHLCRQRACVNPDHLEPVTRAENARRGAQTRLQPEQVRDIRRLSSEGVTQTEIARRFDICRSHVSAIVIRRIWAEI